MAFFKLTGGKATQILPLPGQKETDVQKIVESNLESIFAVRFVAHEFPTGAKHRGRIDTLGLDEDGSPVILEYKRFSSENVINQGLFYLDWLMDHRGDFELSAFKVLGDKTKVVWGQPRLILLAEAFSRYDQYAVNRIDERIELWTYTVYQGDLLRIERMDAEEVTTTSKAKRGPSTKQPKKSAGFDLDHHLAKMSPDSKALFEQVSEQILALGDDVTERFMNQYIGYRRLKNFAEVVAQKKGLNIFIDGPVDDTENIGEDVSNIGHWGTGDLRVKVSNDDDLKKCLILIRQAYEVQH